MTKIRLGLLVCVGLVGAVVAALPLALAEEPQPSPAIPTFGVSSTTVNVDVVVRDKKGNLVRDLTADDFEVYEDGVRQRLDGFAVIGSRSAPKPSETPTPERQATVPAPPPPPSAPQPVPKDVQERERAILALVFDSLSPEARQLACKAAQKFIEKGRRDGDMVGVFAIDLTLHTVQDFTENPADLKTAVDRVARHTGSAAYPAMDKRTELSDRIVRLSATADNQSPQVSNDPTAAVARAVAGLERELTAARLRAEETFDSLEREQRGYATANGLVAIMDGLRILPGRKSVVFFSEGLALPDRIKTQFQSVVNTANRSNVSIYALDSAGLRVSSELQQSREELQMAAQRRMTTLGDPERMSGAPMMKTLERNEDVLQMDPHSGLGMLSEQTGGFLIRGTNDLDPGVRRINEEMRMYYMLGYSPTNDRYDGRFREIRVKVRRSGTDVQARRGYFGVRSAGPVLSYEAPALALLERGARPTAFPLQAEAFYFPRQRGGNNVAVMADVPGSACTYTFDQDAKVYLSDFTILARVLDERGDVIEKFSQRYLLNTPAEQLEATKKKSLLFFRQGRLPRGRYTVDVVAYDNPTSNAALQGTSLDLSDEKDEGLRVGSVLLLGRVEQLPKSELDPDHPLQYGEVLIYPNLGEPLKKSVQPQLAFMVTAFAPPGTAAPKATIEIRRSADVLTRAVTEMPAPGATGRIQHVGSVPLASYRPGEYTLAVTVSQGDRSVVRELPFRIAE